MRKTIQEKKRTSWIVLPAIVAVGMALAPLPANAGPVQVGGGVIDAVMECTGLGHSEDDLVVRHGGPIPEPFIDFGRRNDGFGIKGTPGEYREVAYFQYQSHSGQDWSYYLTGYTSDPDIECATNATGILCREAVEKIDDWLTYTVTVVGEGNLTALRLPPEIDPVEDCPLPQ